MSLEKNFDYYIYASSFYCCWIILLVCLYFGSAHVVYKYNV